MLAVLGFLVLILVADVLWMHSLIFGGRNKGAEAAAAGASEVESELLELLVRHKQAMEAKPPVEEIQTYADRFKVLLVSSLMTRVLRDERLKRARPREGHRPIPQQAQRFSWRAEQQHARPLLSLPHPPSRATLRQALSLRFALEEVASDLPTAAGSLHATEGYRNSMWQRSVPGESGFGSKSESPSVEADET